MQFLQKRNNKNKIWQIVTISLLLSIAFLQCYKTTHDLKWAYDVDFDRDMSFVQGTLDGNYGKDPNITNEYLWYNPLLFLTETAIVKITGLPINIVLARGGTFLNLLGPLAFILMILNFFNLTTALAAIVSYLFLATGNLLGWSSATYSPWLYPATFMQFIFYINILLCYKALVLQKNSWFFLLGLSIGISFLGHTAPTVLILLILITIQFGNIIQAIKAKHYKSVNKYILQGIVAFIPFVLVSLPFLYFIIGKYNLNIVNRMSFEYFDYLFIPVNFWHLLKANLSITLILSINGFIAFYKNCKNIIVRKIFLNWFYISAALFIYTTLVPVIENKYKINLPGLVPSFHFFFYLKAIESVFFGYGFYIIITKVVNLISGYISKQRGRLVSVISTDKILIVIILAIVVLYLPKYTERRDFVYPRKGSIEKENNTDKIQVYDWIVKNISNEEVILCEPDDAIFPVMATGKKMVSINATFSNPYLDFKKREADRLNMLEYLKTGNSEAVEKLFSEYDVKILVVKNSNPYNSKIISQLFSQITFQNNQYTIFKNYNL
jgi:hypothetical protein